MRLVFFVEEPSVVIVLKHLLPKVLLNGELPTFVVFEGKNDFRREFPKKIKGFKQPTQFVVLADQDSCDCKMLKKQLMALYPEQAQHPKPLIRIVCRELESWYLGDLEALTQAYGFNFNKYSSKSKFREPDKLNNAKQELQKLLSDCVQEETVYLATLAAEKIAPHLRLEGNQSASFNVFLQGLHRLLAEAC